MLRKYSKIDLDLLERFAAVLAPFEATTKVMSSQTCVTASLVKPLLANLLERSKPQEDDPPVLHQAKATLYHDIEQRGDYCSFSL